jgi:hypothetical protein
VQMRQALPLGIVICIHTSCQFLLLNALKLHVFEDALVCICCQGLKVMIVGKVGAVEVVVGRGAFHHSCRVRYPALGLVVSSLAIGSVGLDLRMRPSSRLSTMQLSFPLFVLQVLLRVGAH